MFDQDPQFRHVFAGDYFDVGPAAKVVESFPGEVPVEIPGVRLKLEEVAEPIDARLLEARVVRHSRPPFEPREDLEKRITIRTRTHVIYRIESNIP